MTNKGKMRGFFAPLRMTSKSLMWGTRRSRGDIRIAAGGSAPFRKWSPMRFIENAKTPTLVIHSQKDYRLDVSQGFELYTALERRGVPARFLYFPDEGHWVLKPQNSQLWYETVDDWCDRWTKSGEVRGEVRRIRATARSASTAQLAGASCSAQDDNR